MKITIGEPISRIKSSYKVVLEFMHGDGDAYTTEELLVKEESPQLIPFLEYVMNLSINSENERFKHFDFDHSACVNKDDLFEFYYPRDVTGGDFGPGAWFTGYKVTYFDETGTEYEIKLENG